MSILFNNNQPLSKNSHKSNTFLLKTQNGMLKKHVFFLCLFFFLKTINAQNKIYKASLDTTFEMGSKIESIILNNEQTANLILLGKIWGFLKYHHPSVAVGNYNWDFELFHIMPKILKATNSSSRDKILVQWIDSLGIVPPNNAPICEAISDAKQKPDYAWINAKVMSRKLVDKLLFIQKNRSLGEHYYVKVWGDNAPPEFKHEESYDSQTYPDAGFRLLSLYRFWNIIQYYYPYKYAITEETWEGVLQRLVQIFVNAKNAREYRIALLSMLHAVHDSHIVLYKDPIGREAAFKPSIKLQFIEEKVVITEVMDESGLLNLGDVILEKDGENIENIVEKMLPFTPASNKPTQLRTVAQELLCTNEQSLKLKILRGDSVFNTVLPTVHFFYDKPAAASDYSLLSNDVGYIFLGSVKVEELPTLFEQFNETKGIVLDLRNYPSNFQVVYKLSEYLTPYPVPFVKFSSSSIGCPGTYHFNKPLIVGGGRTDYYKGKIVILVNEMTQSRAEFFAMAFKQAPKAIVMGSQTAGADGSFVGFSLPGGYGTGITGVGTYYPDGKETQRIGIIPDIEVKPTINGIKEGRDELLEKAVAYILKD